jgi:UDP-N-acetylmuramoyl-tripeptide--D-alanyl-D-alanine ligase
MPEFSAQSLAQWTGGRWTAEPVSPLSGFCFDSRQLKAGQVFVAIRTDRRDGHDFLAGAQESGAGAAIVATPNPAVALPQLVVADPVRAFQAIAREHRRAFRGPVVGISGSAGKTSTKELLALLLGGAERGAPAPEGRVPYGAVPSLPRFTTETSAAQAASFASGGSLTGRVLATEGNLNNHLGVPLTLTRLDPGAHDFAVVEAGISAPGEMDPLAAMIEPDVTLITLIAPAHTEELGGLDGVANEKAKLAAATRAAGVALFGRDTARYGAFRDLAVRAMVIERADAVRPANPPSDTVYYTLTQREDQTAVAIAYGAPPPRVFTFRRVTDGMAENAVLAICAALWLGMTPELIQSRLAVWRPARLRGEVRHENGRLIYVDCYNANPASMTDALSAFEAIALPEQPRLYILGCMEELGAESPLYHRALGKALELRPEDRVYCVGDFAAEIRAGAIEGRSTADQISIASAGPELARLVAEWRGAVFVKGSRKYQLEKVLAPSSPNPGDASPHEFPCFHTTQNSRTPSVRCGCCGITRCARRWRR